MSGVGSRSSSSHQVPRVRHFFFARWLCAKLGPLKLWPLLVSIFLARREVVGSSSSTSLPCDWHVRSAGLGLSSQLGRARCFHRRKGGMEEMRCTKKRQRKRSPGEKEEGELRGVQSFFVAGLAGVLFPTLNHLFLHLGGLIFVLDTVIPTKQREKRRRRRRRSPLFL